MIKVTCACGEQLECPDAKGGKRGRCPFCKRLWVMPLAPGSPLPPWHVPGRNYLVDPMSIDLSRLSGEFGPDDSLRQSFAEGRASGFSLPGVKERWFPPGCPAPLNPRKPKAVPVPPAAPVDLSRFTFGEGGEEALRRSIAAGSVRGYQRQNENFLRDFATGLPIDRKA